MKEVNEVLGKPNPNAVPKSSTLLAQSTESESNQDDLVPLEEDEDIVLPIPDLDRSLDNFARILKEIHTRFYSTHSTHDTKQIISQLKGSVLDGCVIVFSALFPTNIPPESSDVWKLATAFGAECRTEIDSDVTHVVAARQTPKVLQALQTPGLFLVSADWLHRSCERWERAEEMEFPLSPHPVLMKDSEPPNLVPKAKRMREQPNSDNNNAQPSKKSKPSELEEDEDEDLIGMIEGELENE